MKFGIICLILTISLFPADFAGKLGAQAISAELNSISTQGTDVRTFGAKGDGITDDAPAINNAIGSLKGTGGDIHVPSGTYRLNSSVLIDGSSGITNDSKIIRIIAYGARFYFYGTGGAFEIRDADYPTISGGQIFLNQDRSDVYGLHLQHSRWGRFEDMEIFNGLQQVGPQFAANNRAIYLESGPADKRDNLYNQFSRMRVRRTGWGVYLSNADTKASRNNANVFDVRFGSTNGIQIEGCEGNAFTGSLESGNGVVVALKQNAAGIRSRYNNFEFLWAESTVYSSWAFAADPGCDGNVFRIGNLEFGAINIPGNQNILMGGNGGTVNTELSFKPRNHEADLELLYGGVSGGKNWLFATEELAAANWQRAQVSVTANSVLAPDGTLTAERVEINAANGNLSQTVTTTALDTADKRWTGSVWLRADIPHIARLKLYSASGEGFSRYVYVTSEWKIYYVTGTLTKAAASLGLYLYPADAGEPTGSLYAWGMSLNKGYLGAYLPNGTNAAIRDLGPGILGSKSAALFPRLAFNVDLYLGTIFNNQRIIGYASAAPTFGTWQRGDRLFNKEAAVGAPKGWICTESGTPGNWVSEGNL